ncbi:helix-turn-helix domain-containing protein [Nocardioides okcheonensis]|uniref:helix-turn-helix domain-containing protein n=1 Tax=Nocardioides okcheonensis TaxID=2894081 RepID=UPI001E5FB972|nr:XRE family transcriptional regulator [Nocardioides okcheonensis]UFN43353.1 XRE family transcriptional regulator [Nocardioides okcheonensis]
MSRDSSKNGTNALPVESMLSDFGARLRTLRKERQLSTERLAEAAGVSVGLISQIERGRGNPSFATLAQLAHGLQLPVGQLLEPSETQKVVVRKDERRRLDNHGVVSGDGERIELLTPDLNGALEANWVVTPPGYDTSATPYRHNGEEFGIVLSGTKDVFLDGVRHRLEAGDSIRYASTIPHWYANPSDTEECTAVWVSTPPTW